MNPRMLRLARESRSLSQTALADLSGVSQAAISKAENGLADLTAERLSAIAEALGYPDSLLRWSDEPVGLGSSGFYHRKRASASITKLASIEAQVNLSLMRLRRLWPGGGFEPPYVLPTHDLDEWGGPEHIARSVRAAWRMPSGPVNDMVLTAAKAGVIVERHNFGTPKIDGLSVRSPEGLVLIAVNTGLSACRERFTIAHELGHLVMHESGIREEQDGEAEADRFASEFLMPAADITSQLSRMSLARAAQLKQHWKTSMASIIRRAYTLERITQSQYRSLMVQMSQKGWRKLEPVELPREDLGALERIIDRHLKHLSYSTEQLADVVGLKTAELHTTYSLRPPSAKRGLYAVR